MSGRLSLLNRLQLLIEHLIKAITLAQKQSKWEQVSKLWDAYVELYSTKSVAIRLNWANVLINQLAMPSRGLKVLKPLASVQLPEKQTVVLAQLVRKGQRMISDGTLEISGN